VREHPAKYSDNLITHIGMIVSEYQPDSILDPMAGVGTIARLRGTGFKGRIVAHELEREWAEQTPLTVKARVGNAEDMSWADDGEFGAIITSPTYGNRMADHHNARDGSRRYTYRHMLGRPLTEGNTGMLQWGKKYRQAHVRIWQECLRVLRPGGLFVLNMKDHIRGGELKRVTAWHVEVFKRLGMVVREVQTVYAPGMRHGANRDARLDTEYLVVMTKGERK